jgi:hypothetical protein
MHAQRTGTPDVLDICGRRRSPATYPDFAAGRPPRNKGRKYPPKAPGVEEIVTFLRAIPDTPEGRRLRALAIVAWRSGLRVAELCALEESDLDRRDYAITVRSGKGGKRRVSAMDDWGWDQLQPWLAERREYPIGALFPVLTRPDRRPAARHHARPRRVPQDHRPLRAARPDPPALAPARPRRRALARRRRHLRHQPPARPRQRRHHRALPPDRSRRSNCSSRSASAARPSSRSPHSPAWKRLFASSRLKPDKPATVKRKARDKRAIVRTNAHRTLVATGALEQFLTTKGPGRSRSSSPPTSCSSAFQAAATPSTTRATRPSTAATPSSAPTPSDDSRAATARHVSAGARGHP